MATHSGFDIDRDIQEYLNTVFSSEACAWCKDHTQKLYGKATPLCGYCKGIQQRIRRYERLINKRGLLPPKTFDGEGYELRIEQDLKALAKTDGDVYGKINEKIVEGIDLEEAFGKLSRIAIGRDLFSNDATLLGQYFTLPQRRLLLCILSKIIRIYERRHRRNRVSYSPHAYGSS